MNLNWQWQHPNWRPGWQNNPQQVYPQQQWNQPNQPQNWMRRINIYEAMEIAQQQVQGEIVKVELEREHGMLIYEVEIMTQNGVKYEVEVDTNTGDVLNVELD
ncbi:MAG TPA: PepSY domain-containing protein [Candidatus Avamphibacillus sp.]|nr:PepSY domain-containing protein [Candidatus Avamphibacillus sp.]